MTKRGNRERLDNDEPAPRRRKVVRDWKPTPTPRRQDADEPPRRRIVREPEDDPPRQNVHGEVSVPGVPGFSNLVRSGIGRPAGSKNLIPRKITESFMEAVERLGSDGRGKDGMTGFFMRACEDQPAAALTFASRLLPRHVQTSVDPQSSLGQILEQARARLQFEKAKTIDMRLKDRR